MRIISRLVVPVLLSATAVLAWAEEASLVSPAPIGAKVYFVSPLDGAITGEEVQVRFGLRGMGVAPAGVEHPNTGHHHLLIDHDGDVDMTTPLPTSEQVVHFGGGQTETTVRLSPGEHTLQLLLGNHLHIPHDPPVMSERITIEVLAAE